MIAIRRRISDGRNAKLMQRRNALRMDESLLKFLANPSSLSRLNRDWPCLEVCFIPVHCMSKRTSSFCRPLYFSALGRSALGYFLCYSALGLFLHYSALRLFGTGTFGTRIFFVLFGTRTVFALFGTRTIRHSDRKRRCPLWRARRSLTRTPLAAHLQRVRSAVQLAWERREREKSEEEARE
uniref:Transmembrane protein n=1 Tax=Globodera rostochiensis TaxID=31243 RepID=A0A914I0B8_GLORO